jgi:two-component system, chemotaxis family, protein-glutamate methylesterase/glutaminase
VVQNPEGALFPSMPLSALREIEADHIVSLAEMGELLSHLAAGEGAHKVRGTEAINVTEPRLTDLTCPDCRGTIWETPRADGAEFRCRVGHTFSPKTMLAEHFAAQEKTLYAALATVEEGASLAERLSQYFDPETCARLIEEANERSKQAEAVRKLLRDRRLFRLD